MKNALTSILILGCFLTALAKENDDVIEKEGFEFEIIKQVQTTPVKNQSRTGTCWTFATNSFIETELLRMGKGEYDLSEMFIVRNIYPQKAKNYVRLHGNATFGPGSLSGDALRTFRVFGAVPEQVYSGKDAGYSKHNHSEMDAVLKAALDVVVKNKGKKLSKAWPKAVEGILDAYLSEIPDTFEYKGKKYTPRTFADELGFQPEDYVEITSYLHHPFYTWFSIEIPDNWSFNRYFNVPLDQFMAVIDHAIQKGYSVAWDGDVSEKSFKQKKGVAILPVKQWDDRTKKEQESICDAPEPEIEVTPELRQEAFDNYTSSDDHLMHITGIAKDQNGTKFYITKNSWGTVDHKYDGFIYMSEPYVMSKTVSILVHKDALPASLAQKISAR